LIAAGLQFADLGGDVGDLGLQREHDVEVTAPSTWLSATLQGVFEPG